MKPLLNYQGPPPTISPTHSFWLSRLKSNVVATFLASSIFWDKNAKTSQEFTKCSVFSRRKLKAAIWIIQSYLLLCFFSVLVWWSVVGNWYPYLLSSKTKYISIPSKYHFYFCLTVFPEKLSTMLGNLGPWLTNPLVSFLDYAANLEKVCPSADIHFLSQLLMKPKRLLFNWVY